MDDVDDGSPPAIERLERSFPFPNHQVIPPDWKTL